MCYLFRITDLVKGMMHLQLSVYTQTPNLFTKLQRMPVAMGLKAKVILCNSVCYWNGIGVYT